MAKPKKLKAMSILIRGKGPKPPSRKNPATGRRPSKGSKTA